MINSYSVKQSIECPFRQICIVLHNTTPPGGGGGGVVSLNKVVHTVHACHSMSKFEPKWRYLYGTKFHHWSPMWRKIKWYKVQLKEKNTHFQKQKKKIEQR